ncbi:MAG: dienelactone hydrolase family protein [Sphingomonadales bacterium]
MAQHTRVDIATKDGVAPSHVFQPLGAGPWPAVLLYMDALGIRPAMLAMAERLADMGYFVLLPDLFYREGAYGPFDAQAMVEDPAIREQVFALLGSLTQQRVMDDSAAFFDFLAKAEDARLPAGLVGYCMGGGFALRAAGLFANQVAAAASLHGAWLATDKPDSPHLVAADIKGRVYVGVAGIDPLFPADEEGRLAAALRQAGVDHMIEIYQGAEHGFAVDGHYAFNQAAAEKHWRRLAEIFADCLA